MSLDKIAGLREHFGSYPVLTGIDLEIAQGEVVAIIGRCASRWAWCSSSSTSFRI